MNVDVCPARLQPIFSPRPWGSRSLAPLFPEKSGFSEPIGEAWLTGNECRFASGPFEGQKLAEVWPRMPAEWAGTELRGARSSPFPLLVKFIFSEEKLSVQVHPDDDYAALHEQAAGGCGKTEMWYALRARPGAEVLLGLKDTVNCSEFERAIANGTAEDLLCRVPVQEGDAIFVPARTAHTIGPGLVLCEIQQHSDLTYRVYDYNRRDAQGKARELHVVKALDVMRFGEQLGGKVQPVRIGRGALSKTYLAFCRYFASEKWEFGAKISAATAPEHFDLLIFLEGSGNLRWQRQHAEYAPAQVWLVPAALGAYDIEPSSATSLLHTYVPSASGDLSRELCKEGISAEAIARLVHQC